MVEAVARILLGGGKRPGGWLSVLSEQMERRGSAEAVAVLKSDRGVMCVRCIGQRGGSPACCRTRWSTWPRIGRGGRWGQSEVTARRRFNGGRRREQADKKRVSKLADILEY